VLPFVFVHLSGQETAGQEREILGTLNDRCGGLFDQKASSPLRLYGNGIEVLMREPISHFHFGPA